MEFSGRRSFTTPPAAGSGPVSGTAATPPRSARSSACPNQAATFSPGGNVFAVGDHLVDTSKHHRLGDICLFRSDLWHEVTPVEPEARLDLRSARGRWTAVLPLVASS